MLGSILGAVGGLIGSSMSAKSQQKIAAQQAALQKEFAQSGIQWRVADAKKAGVHPLAALGMQGASYTPQSVGTPDYGSSFSQMGQNIGNALYKTMDPHTRTQMDLATERAGLENELLRTQINSLRATRTQSPGIATVAPSRTGQPAMSEPPAPEHTGLRFAPAGIVLTDPANSDAQKFEDRYGESADWIEGPLNRFYDYFYRFRGMPFGAWRELQNMRAENFHAGRGFYYGFDRHYRHR